MPEFEAPILPSVTISDFKQIGGPKPCDIPEGYMRFTVRLDSISSGTALFFPSIFPCPTPTPSPPLANLPLKGETWSSLAEAVAKIKDWYDLNPLSGITASILDSDDQVLIFLIPYFAEFCCQPLYVCSYDDSGSDGWQPPIWSYPNGNAVECCSDNLIIGCCEKPNASKLIFRIDEIDLTNAGFINFMPNVPAYDESLCLSTISDVRIFGGFKLEWNANQFTDLQDLLSFYFQPFSGYYNQTVSPIFVDYSLFGSTIILYVQTELYDNNKTAALSSGLSLCEIKFTKCISSSGDSTLLSHPDCCEDCDSKVRTFYRQNQNCTDFDTDLPHTEQGSGIVQNNVFGLHNGTPYGLGDLLLIMNNYPNLIDFSLTDEGELIVLSPFGDANSYSIDSNGDLIYSFC